MFRSVRVLRNTEHSVFRSVRLLRNTEHSVFRSVPCSVPFRVLVIGPYRNYELSVQVCIYDLVTYLDVGNFCDKRTEKTLHKIRVQGLIIFSDSNKSN